ncbi:hypothetical protein BU17DRAFT_79664 [Hysterangium stoloniferum]|nr:hypothetical protein BU17DRAFT_79664 [Hysterangium stoloniferum]
MDFNETVGLHYASADSDSKYLSSVRQCRQVADLLALPEFETGPFVIEHDDLSSANILVDDDFNITGIIDFPGTTVPFPSFLTYPFFTYENFYTLMNEREVWKTALKGIKYPSGSPLQDEATLERLTESLDHRTEFEQALKVEIARHQISLVLEELEAEDDSDGDGDDGGIDGDGEGDSEGDESDE